MLEQVFVQDITDPLLLAYEERQRRLRRDPKTVQMFRQTARRFQRYLDDMGQRAADVEPVALEEYLVGLDLAPSTKEAHLKRLKWAYHYALRRGAIRHDPTIDVLLPRVPDKEPTIIPNDELRAMKGRIMDDRTWVLFHLLAYAGLRRHETKGLTWDDVDLETATLTIHGKAGKLRKVPIHPALAEALVELPQREGYVTPGRQGKQLSDCGWDPRVRSFTLGKYTAHAFRRTVSSSLYHNDVEPDTIDEILGWAPRTVRGRYYQKIASAKLQRAILRLYADDPV